jgi:hypothetical protein
MTNENEICSKCGQEIVKLKTIVIDNVEYELEQHDNNKELSDIKIPKGWRLLKPCEAQRLWDLGYLRNNWFYVENTNLEEKKKGNVAGFIASSDGASLGCNGDPDSVSSSLGVVFAKDLRSKK